MYDSIINDLFWPDIANTAYATVRDRRSRVQNRTHGKHQRQLKLFLPEGSLEYIGMEILGPQPKTKQSNLFVVVMTDLYNKMIKAISTTKKIVTQ